MLFLAYLLSVLLLTKLINYELMDVLDTKVHHFNRQLINVPNNTEQGKTK